MSPLFESVMKHHRKERNKTTGNLKSMNNETLKKALKNESKRELICEMKCVWCVCVGEK